MCGADEWCYLVESFAVCFYEGDVLKVGAYVFEGFIDGAYECFLGGGVCFCFVTFGEVVGVHACYGGGDSVAEFEFAHFCGNKDDVLGVGDEVCGDGAGEGCFADSGAGSYEDDGGGGEVPEGGIKA